MKYIAPIILGLFAVGAVGCANPQGGTALEQRGHVNKMHDDALAELYQKNPEAKDKIANAAGHGVFSYYGTNLLLLATEGGYGMVVDHASGQKTYMRLAGGGVGIGVGVKDARAVVVFASKTALDAFLDEGGKFTFGASTDAVMKKEGQVRGKSSVAKSGQVEVYPLNRGGMTLAASLIGTKFYPDPALNVDAPETTPNPATETVAESADAECYEDCTLEAALADNDDEAKRVEEWQKAYESSKPAESSDTTADTQFDDGYDD